MEMPGAFSPRSDSAARWFAHQDNWWADHFVEAPAQIVDFLAGDGLDIEGKDVLDLGCGDGIISLGLATRGVRRLLGVDLEEVDLDFLSTEAVRHGERWPQSNLGFEACMPSSLPVGDRSFDLVSAWSVFEHVADPTTLMTEVHRVLRPDGLFFIQIWPLWASEHGAHLWPWLARGHEHLVETEAGIADELRASIHSPALLESFLDLQRSCNRLTIDQLQQSLIESGFYIAKVSLEGDTFHVRPELQTYPLSMQGISGIKVLAVAR